MELSVVDLPLDLVSIFPCLSHSIFSFSISQFCFIQIYFLQFFFYIEFFPKRTKTTTGWQLIDQHRRKVQYGFDYHVISGVHAKD